MHCSIENLSATAETPKLMQDLSMKVIVGVGRLGIVMPKFTPLALFNFHYIKNTFFLWKAI